MKGRALVLVTVTLFGGTPAISQQDADTVLQRPGFAGQVEVSPIPRVKIVRPADNPADNDAEDAAKSDANADADADDAAKPQVGDGALTPPTAGNVPGAETEKEEKQPRVVRLGGDLSKSETTEAGDGTWKEERDDRLKTVPKRASLSDVEQNAPPPIVPIETPDTNLMRGARLRQLDKMTGQIQTYDMAVGEAVQVARLRIRLDACRAPGPNNTHGTMAFMKIWDTKKGTQNDPDFSGWMFAESPALSSLDHPRYTFG